jgi:hypothetical protein
MKKITSILSSVLLVSFTLVPVSAVLADESTSTSTSSAAATTNIIVGNDRDVHGCIGSAGYSWCEVKNKCLRPWEEKCVATTTPVLVPPQGPFGGLKNFIDQKKAEIKDLMNAKKDIKSEIKDLRKATGTRPDMRNATGSKEDWRNGSSTASTTRADMEKKQQERKDAMIKKNIDDITQNLTNVAAKLGALGTEIKAIVSGQASSSDAISQAVSKEDGRGFWGKFIFGADPKNLGVIVSQVSIMQARVNQLNNQISKLATSTDKTTLVTNVQALKDQIVTLEQYVKDNINSFSLFGWLNNYNKQN